MNRHSERMEECLTLARAHQGSDIPIAAMIFGLSDVPLASAINTVERDDDPLGHAELNVIKMLGRNFLRTHGLELTIYVTLEPCPMCAWAIARSGINSLVYGASNGNYGSAGSMFDLLRDGRFGSTVEVTSGIFALESGELVSRYFENLRNNSQR